MAGGLEKFLFPCLGGDLNSQPLQPTGLLEGVGGPRLLGCQPHATSVTTASSLPKPPSSEQKLDLQPEPTVSFLFTLLSTAEPHKPKDPEE